MILVSSAAERPCLLEPLPSLHGSIADEENKGSGFRGDFASRGFRRLRGLGFGLRGSSVLGGLGVLEFKFRGV